MKLTGLCGGSYVSDEAIETPCEIDEIVFQLRLYVVDDSMLPTQLLLGDGIFKTENVTVTIAKGKLQFTSQAKVLKMDSTHNENSRRPIEVGDVRSEDMDPQTLNSLVGILNEYRSVFADDLTNLGRTDLVEMEINVDSSQPITQRPYRVPEAKKAVVNEMIEELLQCDIVASSTSDYASPMLLVKKKNGKNRLCVDYRRLNQVTVKEVFPSPREITELRKFLGLSGYFRKFVPAYAFISEPLRTLLRKDQEFSWTIRQQEAFDHLKSILSSKPVLTGYRLEADHEIHTDASAIGIAGVLLQDEGEYQKPIAYFSRSTTNCERKYHSYELEALAVVETLERFRYYVYGKRVKVVTDCTAVTALNTKKEILPRIARWWMKIHDFDIVLEHRSGQRMPHVDALSRAPVEEPHEVDTAGSLVAKVRLAEEDWLFSAQLSDPRLREVVDKLYKGDLSVVNEYVCTYGRLYRKSNGRLLWVVLKQLRWKVVFVSHDRMGHLSVDKTLERLQVHLWFARMRNFVKSYIASCVECVFNKRPGGRKEAEYYYTDIDGRL